MKTLRIRVGTNLAWLRKQRRMTQEDVAAVLDVTRQLVGSWEEFRGVPNLRMLLQVCQLFGVTVDDLLQKDFWTATEAKKVPARCGHGCHRFSAGGACQECRVNG